MTPAAGEAAASRPRGVARLLDAVALLLLAGGTALYLYARNGMGAVAAGRMQYGLPAGIPGGGSNTDQVARLERLSGAGLWIAAAGVLLSIAAFAWLKLRRQPALPDEQADHS